jgi:hypothetical protein
MRRVLALKPLAGMLALAAVLLLALPGAAHALEQRLVASDGADGDGFGRSVAIEGDTAVVGAPTGPDYRGAVYVFTRSGDSWTQSAKLTASDRESGARLGSSLAIDGDTIVAGAPQYRICHLSDCSGPGYASVFSTTANAFSLGEVKRNKKKGTAKLGVNVPGPGELDLAKTRRVKHRGKRAPAEGEVMLAIKPRRKAKRALGKQGRAWVGAEVTYTPDGGEPNTKSKRVKLRRK